MGKLAARSTVESGALTVWATANPRRREEYLQDVQQYLDFCRASSVTALSEQTLQEQLYDQE
jgi:hypothetical protein